MTPVGVNTLRLPTGVEWTGRRITYIHPVGDGDVKGDGVPVRAPDPTPSASMCAQYGSVYLISNHVTAAEMSQKGIGRVETSTSEKAANEECHTCCARHRYVHRGHQRVGRCGEETMFACEEDPPGVMV